MMLKIKVPTVKKHKSTNSQLHSRAEPGLASGHKRVNEIKKNKPIICV